MGVTGPSGSEVSTPSALGSDLGEGGADGASTGKTNSNSKLMFAPWHSAVDEGFWHRLASFKLETQRLAELPVSISGYFAPCSHPQISSHLQLLEESLPPDPGGSSSTSYVGQGNRNKCPVPGTLYNSNTLENFTGLDTPSLLKITVQQIWEDIQSGKAEETSNLLCRFLLISFADLKKWSFYYWFAFPAIVITPSVTTSSCRPVSDIFGEEEFRKRCLCRPYGIVSTGSSFFLLHFTSDGAVTARPIKDWKVAHEEGGKIIAAFYDPCNIPTNPGWPLRNLLALAVARWEVKELRVLCYREKRGFIDLQLSLIVDVELPELPEWKAPGFVPKGVGWELNSRGKARPRSVHLAATMDPERAANQAAELNLKLMRSRLLHLDLPLLSTTKCLLLGAGTLGCQMARGLLAWGIRHITFVDYGKVAMSNPCRQSLYNVEDCLNGGKQKVDAAVSSLKRIIPGVEASGVYMSIPMPGHSVIPAEVENVLADCSRLKALVDEHDVVFLLTDTRESRWLPTLLFAEANKVAINAALGFDTYLVMRHGAGPARKYGKYGENMETAQAEISLQNNKRLGCYFCNDVVAPLDSTVNRTLDQQCTVTRPGLAPNAAALAVELAVNLLHHPQRINAPADQAVSITDTTAEPLGILLHQVRGFVAYFSQLVVLGSAFDKCTVCSSIVVEGFRRRGVEFILGVLNRPNYLEDLTGLTEMVAATQGMSLDWDDEAEFTDEDV